MLLITLPAARHQRRVIFKVQTFPPTTNLPLSPGRHPSHLLFGGFEVQPMERHENTARKRHLGIRLRGTGHMPGLVENTEESDEIGQMSTMWERDRWRILSLS